MLAKTNLRNKFTKVNYLCQSFFEQHSSSNSFILKNYYIFSYIQKSIYLDTLRLPCVDTISNFHIKKTPSFLEVKLL